MNDEHRRARSSRDRGAIMLELWRRVVIGSAVAVYIAGLACAGSLLVWRIEARAGLLSLAAFHPDAPAAAAGTGRR
jgi:hypothetical protein